MQIVIVTGLSGAGKTTALHALEDLGFYCVDNLPMGMLGDLVQRIDSSFHPRFRGRPGEPMAQDERYLGLGVVIDARDPGVLGEVDTLLESLRADGHDVDLLFVEAPKTALIRRFSETRRRHPLGELPEAIEHEIHYLAPLREYASEVIDTEGLPARELRLAIGERYGQAGRLYLVLLSFGFKRALPQQADSVFDVRYLTNPYYIDELRPLSGLDTPVQDFVRGQENYPPTLKIIEDWARFKVPLSLEEGRSAVTLAVGCTGGQHRSVTIIEHLSQRLTEVPLDPRVVIRVRHRDVKIHSGSAGDRRKKMDSDRGVKA